MIPHPLFNYAPSHSALLEKEMGAALVELQALVQEGRTYIAKEVGDGTPVPPLSSALSLFLPFYPLTPHSLSPLTTSHPLPLFFSGDEAQEPPRRQHEDTRKTTRRGTSCLPPFTTYSPSSIMTHLPKLYYDCCMHMKILENDSQRCLLLYPHILATLARCCQLPIHSLTAVYYYCCLL